MWRRVDRLFGVDRNTWNVRIDRYFVYKLDAILVLEDGRAYRGRSIGCRGRTFGEVVFNTSMTGYQEIASDPSYSGQIVAFTAPQIGNYGIAKDDAQAPRPLMQGLVVRELSQIASNWRSQMTLADWLEENGVVGIAEVDTRALTRALRDKGAMRAGIFSDQELTAWPPADAQLEPLVEAVRESPSLVGRDLTAEASTQAVQSHNADAAGPHLALLDFGVKKGIVDALCARGLRVTQFPATTPADEIGRLGADALFLSNGPGDPDAVRPGVETVSELVGKLPIFGICMGHQIMALALGAKTYKMSFGHHGGNHPVKDLQTGQVWITAQNHGFAVDPDTLPGGAQITHRSLYDGTLEGFAVEERRVRTVQYHPEGCPGPSDAQPFFDRMVLSLKGGTSNL
jgi:carbamoyl-phosphate synthase small subunit